MLFVPPRGAGGRPPAPLFTERLKKRGNDLTSPKVLKKISGGKMKKRVLVCDDEESIRLLLREALQDTYEIVEAADGRETLKMVAREPFDLVVLDIKMPHVHGLAAIERIRQKNNTIPIIICSAYRIMQDDIVVKTSDIAAFFTKPIDILALKRKVFELIGK